jgi:hypothetical protein
LDAYAREVGGTSLLMASSQTPVDPGGGYKIESPHTRGGHMEETEARAMVEERRKGASYKELAAKYGIASEEARVICESAADSPAVKPDIEALARRCIELHDEHGAGFYDIDEWNDAEDALRAALDARKVKDG